MVLPNSLARDISPPPTRKPPVTTTSSTIKNNPTGKQAATENEQGISSDDPTLAAIEAGEAQVRDHLEYFSHHFRLTSRDTQSALPRITIDDFQDLYRRNNHAYGCHFVIHQHDHPISGVHYDLRLQFSQTSTISFAIPYGLPGNPNSIRPNRMAIETRVHNLWNNLIESASHATGSLLIWDTGEYEVLPYKQPDEVRTTDDELSDADADVKANTQTNSEKLFEGFQAKRIRLRLHGTRLPQGYTISLRLPSANDRRVQPRKPLRKRRRLDPSKVPRRGPASTDSENESEPATINTHGGGISQAEDVNKNAGTEAQEAALASEAEDEDAAIRANNAYTGAINTIGSIHQRRWFLTLDRVNTGFHKARSGTDRGRWIGECQPFIVRGREVERSVVSGRSADEVMADADIKAFQGRKMWRPITE